MIILRCRRCNGTGLIQNEQYQICQALSSPDTQRYFHIPTEEQVGDDDDLQHDAWLAQIAEWRAESVARDILSWPDDGKLYTAKVIRDMWELTGGEAIVTTGVGQHQMWAAQYYAMDQPFRLITSGGAGTMGFGLPSAIGAWFAHQDKEVWVVDGDGSFQMTLQELGTKAA